MTERSLRDCFNCSMGMIKSDYVAYGGKNSDQMNNKHVFLSTCRSLIIVKLF